MSREKDDEKDDGTEVVNLNELFAMMDAIRQREENHLLEIAAGLRGGEDREPMVLLGIGPCKVELPPDKAEMIAVRMLVAARSALLDKHLYDYLKNMNVGEEMIQEILLGWGHYRQEQLEVTPEEEVPDLPERKSPQYKH